MIEREAVDPDGVREILARCPDCLAAFDEMKAALAVAEQLPIVEPPAAVDAAILRAAGERAPRVVRLKKRRLQPAPWAMAMPDIRRRAVEVTSASRIIFIGLSRFRRLKEGRQRGVSDSFTVWDAGDSHELALSLWKFLSCSQL